MVRYLILMLVALPFHTIAYASEKVPATANNVTITVQAKDATAISNVTVANKVPSPAPPTSTSPVATKMKTNRFITFSMFLAIIALTLGIVAWAARSTKTASDYYTAGGGISGMQNGWAIAGDFLSASTFLGITGLISIFGIDGFLYGTGPMVAFITILLLIAEPCRNAGKYTLGDILSFRSSPTIVRIVAATSTVTLSVFYLGAQMVGAGKLMQVLLNIPYNYSVIGVGVLIIFYVAYGGMKATTWVQIIKAVLLMSSGILMSVLVLWKSGMNPIRFFDDIVANAAIQEHVRTLLKNPAAEAGFDYGQRFLEPSLFLKNPLDQVSLGITWVLGVAGLPHILMRFFTVPTAKAARKSVIVAMFLIGFFFIMTSILGLGAAIYVTPQNIMALDKGGNMSVLMLAQYLGGGAGTLGGDLLFAFVCAVCFATILAVVSGLVLASSAAIAHDIYVNVIKKGKADEREQVNVAKITSLAVGILAIVMGIVAEKENIAHLVALAFAVAASGNFPILVLSLFWKKFNTAGIVSGFTVGTLTAITLVLVSPTMTYPKKVAADAQRIVDTLTKKQADGTLLSDKELKTLEKSRADYTKNRDGRSIVGLEAPLFQLKNPGIVSVPFGFIAAVFGCLLFRDRRAEEMFDELYVRQNTGYGISKAEEH